MTEIVTVDGDMLDSICKAEYGHESMIVTVLEANPNLAKLGPVFDAGVRIALPEDVQPENVPVVRLWD